MIALIIDKSQKNRLLIGQFLSELTFSKLIFCDSLKNAHRQLSGLEWVDLVVTDEWDPNLLEGSFRSLAMAGIIITRKRLLGEYERGSRMVKLERPFGIKKLKSAVQKALELKLNENKTLWLLSSLDRIPQVSLSGRFEDYQIKQGSLQELELYLSQSPKDLFAILAVEDDSLKSSLSHLSRLKQSPIGARIPWVSLKTDNQSKTLLRTQAEFFRRLPLDSRGWKELLEALYRHRQFFFLIRIGRIKFRTAINKAFFFQSFCSLLSLLRLPGLHPQVLDLIGDFWISLGLSGLATRSYLRSLKSNPCRPYPYIKLMQNKNRVAISLFESVREQSQLFCPRHPQIVHLSTSITPPWAQPLPGEA
jgi:CheY-like chemotaxis protein